MPAVVKDHPSGFWVFAPGGKDRYSPEHFSTFLDLSPLQKFMGGGDCWDLFATLGDGRRVVIDRIPNGVTVEAIYKEFDEAARCWQFYYLRSDRGLCHAAYGMDYDFDWVPPAPSPEKSPQEKALEDFIAKRKAKREGAGVFGGIGRDAEDAEMRRAIKEEADGRILDRAMRRLSFHEQDIHTRLMPYRREEK